MKKVLIVEDEIFVALDMQAMVEEAGYEVVGIAAESAEARALGDDCDIALVDVNLRDGATGPEIGRWLTRERNVRVVYVTANPAQVLGETDAGIGVIGKPASVNTLKTALEVVAAEQLRLDREIDGFIPLPAFIGAANAGESRR